MKKIILFLLFFGALISYLLLQVIIGTYPLINAELRLPIICIAVGGLGGVVYCLRGVYINACVHARWSDNWEPWYYIRPFVSLICGGVSWLFLKAGLLLLDATTTDSSSDLGFYALAFIAGLNVDKFVSKIEDIAQAAWGIEKSRTAKSGNGS